MVDAFQQRAVGAAGGVVVVGLAVERAGTSGFCSRKEVGRFRDHAPGQGGKAVWASHPAGMIENTFGGSFLPVLAYDPLHRGHFAEEQPAILIFQSDSNPTVYFRANRAWPGWDAAPRSTWRNPPDWDAAGPEIPPALRYRARRQRGARSRSKSLGHRHGP